MQFPAGLHHCGTFNEVINLESASAHRVSVGARSGYQTDVTDILRDPDAMDNSTEAIAAGTQWTTDDPTTYTPSGSSYDILAYAIDMVQLTRTHARAVEHCNLTVGAEYCKLVLGSVG